MKMHFGLDHDCIGTWISNHWSSQCPSGNCQSWNREQTFQVLHSWNDNENGNSVEKIIMRMWACVFIFISGKWTYTSETDYFFVKLRSWLACHTLKRGKAVYQVRRQYAWWRDLLLCQRGELRRSSRRTFFGIGDSREECFSFFHSTLREGGHAGGVVVLW